MLHASTCRSGARPEIGKIVKYMNGEGFAVEHMQDSGLIFHPDGPIADVLLLGCNSRQMERAKEAMDEMERGLHGILREWDVLWYFTDGHVPDHALRHMDGSGLCADDRFAAEGICMMRAHIRRRHDATSHRGLHITLEQWIVDGIDRIVPPNPKWDSFGKKVKRLKKHIGADGRDKELFFAATEFLMKMRNRSSHPNDNTSFKKRRESYNHFEKVAARYAFDFDQFIGHEVPTDDPNHQDWHVLRRACVALARIARAWLEEYYAALPERSGHSGPASPQQSS